MIDLAILDAARERLNWIQGEYGDDDIDYLTFKPVLDFAASMVARIDCPFCAPDEPCALHLASPPFG